MGRGSAVLAAVAALLLVPAGASAASPVLEFVVPSASLPVHFTTHSGEIKAVMAGSETLVHCTESSGAGEITGPRSTVSEYKFTGCTTNGGASKCESEGASPEEITTGPIDAELVFIDQAKREVGVLLNPGGGLYISFECGGIPAKGEGPFLAPVAPIDELATSFAATLSESGSVQTPDEYEDEAGERRQALPVGTKGLGNPFVPTGVTGAFDVLTSVPVEVKAVTAAEVEAAAREQAAKKHEEEALETQAAASAKHQEEQAAAAAATSKRLEAEAAAATAARKRVEEELAATKHALQAAEKPASKPPSRAQLLAKALQACRKSPQKRRARCEANAQRRYGGSSLRARRRR